MRLIAGVMTQSAMTAPSDKAATIRGSLITLFAFVTAIFVSAYLLFAIQPLFTKMALPMLGGSPNVWNTALVFFQGVLLLGYLYTHCITKFLNIRQQVGLHVLIIIVGLAFLPIGLNVEAVANVQGGQSIWLLTLMAVSIGWPFFALSANAPLLQRWFSMSSHPTADDPYFLYAASNAGSILSLLLYPFFIEPITGLDQQSTLWAQGYGLLIALIAFAGLCALIWPRISQAVEKTTEIAVDALSAPSWSSRGFWVLLAAIPSGLMLAVTTYLTTDVAPAPFLWILPLTLYLVSFIIVFSPIADPVHRALKKLAPIAILAGAALSPIMRSAVIEAWLLHLIVFFLITTALHGALAKRRPAATHLTEFYLLMSLGGVIGGIFTALIAPAFFPDIWEYPILLILSAAIISFVFLEKAALLKNEQAPLTRNKKAIIAGLFVVALLALIGMITTEKTIVFLVCAVAISLITYAAKERPVMFAVAIASLLFVGPSLRSIAAPERYELIFRDRSFFGVVSVKKIDHENGLKHVFFHGTTIHNSQYRRADLRQTPATYYGFGASFDQVVRSVRAQTPNMKVGVIGLGAGALACHRAPGEQWTFHEIDPMVVQLARDENLFSFVSDCTPDAPIVIGDGRINLEREQASAAPLYDLIIIDAFSSDAIPAHLLTTDALALYRERLPEDGVIFLHTSNKYLDVTSVALASAKALGLSTKVIRFNPDEAQLKTGLVVGTIGVAISTQEKIDLLSEGQEGWIDALPNDLIKPWTDQSSNILNAMIAQKRGGYQNADVE